MSKQAYREPAYDDSTPMEPAQQTVRLAIRGLKAVYGEEGVFELSGVKPRSVDCTLLAAALGCPEDDELIDKVRSTVWKFDMVRLLTDRIVA